MAQDLAQSREGQVQNVRTIVEVCFYVTMDDPTECPNKVVHLSWARTTNRVGDTHSDIKLKLVSATR